MLIKWLLGRCLVAILRLPLLYCCKCNYKFVHLIITTSTDQFPTCCEITCKPTHEIVLVVSSLPVSLSFSEMGVWRCKGVKRCYIWNAPKNFFRGFISHSLNKHIIHERLLSSVNNIKPLMVYMCSVKCVYVVCLCINSWGLCKRKWNSLLCNDLRSVVLCRTIYNLLNYLVHWGAAWNS